MEKNTQQIAGVVSIVAGLVAIGLLWETKPILALFSSILVLSGIVLVLYLPYYRGFRTIRLGLKNIIQQLRDKQIHPDYIVSFNRSGAAIASMLSVNLGVERILHVPRWKQSDTGANDPAAVRQYDVGRCISLSSDEFANKSILVVFMLIDTTRTATEGFDYLYSQGISQQNISVATIFITSGARNRFPGVLYAYERDNARHMLHRLPWVLENYHLI